MGIREDLGGEEASGAGAGRGRVALGSDET